MKVAFIMKKILNLQFFSRFLILSRIRGIKYCSFRWNYILFCMNTQIIPDFMGKLWKGLVTPSLTSVLVLIDEMHAIKHVTYI